MKTYSTVYLEKPGLAGTQACVKAAAERAKELGIRHIAVATSTGRTALAMAKALKAVGHKAQVVGVGYSEEYAAKWGRLDPKLSAQAQKLGAKFVAGTHVLGGIDSAVASQFGGTAPGKLIAAVYYTAGQGFKVAVEVAMMAADQGAVPAKPILALGGTAEGADTALVLTPANASQFFKLKIHQVACMVSGPGLR